MHRFETTIFGEPVTYTLEGTTVTRAAAEEQRADLGDLDRVQLASLGNMEVCELQFTGDLVVTVTSDEPADRAAMLTFLQHLHDAIPDTDRVEFVRGGWMLVGLVASIVVLCWIAALAVTLFAMPDTVAAKAGAFQGLACLVTLAGPLAAWKMAPKRYDPTQVTF
ncbi:MAG: hypothetical protein GY913_32630 [Proteobacteria bacterium]|nr:hypothetical protein [Pseudomonadota bacterium]MCP4921669.1 hypothetical protein [Pseudomonadota bacterium]